MIFKSGLTLSIILYVIFTFCMFCDFFTLETYGNLLFISIWIIGSYFHYKLTDFRTTNIIIEKNKLVFIKPIRLFGLKRIDIDNESIERIEVRLQRFRYITLYFKNKKYKTISTNLSFADERILILSLNELFNRNIKVFSYYDRDVSDKYLK